MLKKILSVIAAAAVMPTAAHAAFKDINEYSAEYKAVSELDALGIVEGDENGNFNPHDTVTRAEFTKMVIIALGDEQLAKSFTMTGFEDCGGHWAMGYIEAGVTDGFISGYSKEKFGPDDDVTYVQAVKMLVAATGYTVYAENSGGWPSGYIKYGGSLGITKGVSGIENNTPLTRATIAVLIDNALDVPLTLSTYPGSITILDGRQGRDYETLLTNKHDAYRVKGRITNTSRSSGLKKGYVDYRVEVSDCFDGTAYSSNNAETFQVRVGDVNMTDWLFIYSEALIQKEDMTDEYVMLTIRAK